MVRLTILTMPLKINMLILQLKIISSNNEIKDQFLLKKHRGDESNSCLI